MEAHQKISMPNLSELDVAIEAALQAHRKVAAVSSALCLDPVPPPSLEADFTSALGERRDACTVLGSFVLRWVAAGGTFQTSPRKETTPETPIALVRPRTDTPVRVGPKPDPIQVGKVVARLQHAVRIGIPVDKAADFTSLVSALSAVTLEIDKWVQLPQPQQKALLGLCASLARHLQDEAAPACNLPPGATLSLGPVFSRLTSYSRNHQPGFVLGLSRTHGPEYESWMEDAVGWAAQLGVEPPPRPVKVPDAPLVLPKGDTVAFVDAARALGVYKAPEEETKEEPANPERRLNELVALFEEDPTRQDVCTAVRACIDAGLKQSDPRLVRILEPHIDFLLKDPTLKALRKNIRESRDADEAAAKVDNAELPPDWPFFNYTRGKRVVVLGGDRRGTTTTRLQRVFGIEEVIWESGWQKRRIQALGSQIEAGTISMVIFLARFMSHSTWDAIRPICKAQGVPFVRVESGYGMSQIKAAMEHTLTGFSQR